jgi:hypothetical protein
VNGDTPEKLEMLAPGGVVGAVEKEETK